MRSLSFGSNLQKLFKKLVKGISHFDSPTPICINMNIVKNTVSYNSNDNICKTLAHNDIILTKDFEKRKTNKNCIFDFNAHRSILEKLSVQTEEEVKCNTNTLSRVPFDHETQNYPTLTEAELFFELCLRNLGYMPMSELEALVEIGAVNPVVDMEDPRDGEMWSVQELNKILNSVDNKDRSHLLSFINSHSFKNTKIHVPELDDIRSKNCTTKNFSFNQQPATKTTDYVHFSHSIPENTSSLISKNASSVIKTKL